MTVEVRRQVGQGPTGVADEDPRRPPGIDVVPLDDDGRRPAGDGIGDEGVAILLLPAADGHEERPGTGLSGVADDPFDIPVDGALHRHGRVRLEERA
jgi:hypothetical protein